jgi:hypothetical protein
MAGTGNALDDVFIPCASGLSLCKLDTQRQTGTVYIWMSCSDRSSVLSPRSSSFSYLTGTNSVPVKAGLISPVHSYLSSNGLPGKGQLYAGRGFWLTFVARDSFKNLVYSADNQVDYLISNSGGVPPLESFPLTGPLTSRYRNGYYYVYLSIKTAGVFSIQLSINGVSLTSTSLTVLPTSTSGRMSTAMGDLKQIQAYHPSSFTISARDLYGNLRPSSTDSLKVLLRYSHRYQSASAVSSVRTSALGAGKYLVAYNITDSVGPVSGSNVLAGGASYRMDVSLNNQGIQGSPFTVFVTPDYTDLIGTFDSTLSFTSGELNMVAGVSKDISFVVRRQGGGVPDNKFVLKYGTVASFAHLTKNEDRLFLGANFGSFPDGHLKTRNTLTVAGKYKTQVMVDGQQVQGSPFITVVAPSSIYEIRPVGNALLSATAGVTVTFTVNLADKYGNIRSDAADETALSVGSSPNMVFKKTYNVTTGSIEVTYTPTSARAYTLYLTASGARTVYKRLTVSPGAPDASKAYLWSPTSLPAILVGSKITIYLRTTDALGNAIYTSKPSF